MQEPQPLCRHLNIEKINTGQVAARRARRERPRGGRPAERGQEFSSFDVACHVTLRWGVIHAMEKSYHASIARSVTTSRSGRASDRDYPCRKTSFERQQIFTVPLSSLYV